MIKTSKDEVITSRKRWYQSAKQRNNYRLPTEQARKSREARRRLEDLALAKELGCSVSELM